MKISNYSSIAITLVTLTLAQEFVPAYNNTPALSSKARNPLDRRAIDYCGVSSFYCVDSACCGTTLYNCLPDGAQCCASLSAYGYGLYCYAGTTCVVQSGTVQCQKSGGGGIVSAGSSLAPTATSTDSDPTETGTSGSGGSGSGGSSKTTKTKKKKGKGWIGGAVAGPLIGIALVAAVVFFLRMLKKKQKSKAEASNAATMAANSNNDNQPSNNNAAGNGYNQPPMAAMAPAPNMSMAGGGGVAPMYPNQNPDYKTPAYVQQHEVPTPLSSPPPQWSSAAPMPTSTSGPHSPAPTAIPPVPTAVSPAPNTYGHHQNPGGSVSPIGTGNGNGYGQQPVQTQMYQPQPIRGNATELSTTTGLGAQQPRNGAHEIGG